MTQFYIGCKQVQAWRDDHEADANDPIEGYAVKYPDGYTSWCPREIFERSYIPQGHDGTRVTAEMVEGFVSNARYTRLGNHTVVLVTLVNGFTILESSACVDPANYDEKIGQSLAMEKAIRKVSEYLGFMLASARNGVCL